MDPCYVYKFADTSMNLVDDLLNWRPKFVRPGFTRLR
jgi:hypothetical protein